MGGALLLRGGIPRVGWIGDTNSKGDGGGAPARTIIAVVAERTAEFAYEETGDEIILMKDTAGRVIESEKLDFSAPSSVSLQVEVETVLA